MCDICKEVLGNGGHPTKITQVVSLSHGGQFKVGENKYASRFVSYIFHLEFRDTILILKECELYYNFTVLVSLFAHPWKIQF